MKRPTIRTTIAAAALLLGGLTASADTAQAAETCLGLTPNIVGTEGNDVLHGTTFGDVIVGLGGNDVITGFDATVCAGSGDDQVTWDPGTSDPGDAAGLRVDAGPGDDTVDAGSLGLGVLYGGTGNDELSGGWWGNSMFGGPGNDTLTGSSGRVFGLGFDILHGGSGNDILRGYRGKDTLYGGTGDDHIFGGRGRDTLRGNRDKDTLYGGTGDDHIFGGRGIDEIFGGRGFDICRSPMHAPGCNG